MKIGSFLKLGFGVVAITSTMAGCGGDDDPSPVPMQPMQGSVAEVAKDKGFNALLAAATKAGIATTLTDANAHLTVFAPTDKAFADLAVQLGFADATAMVNALPANTLKSILTYHVLTVRESAADLRAAGATQSTAFSFENAPAKLTLDTANGVKIMDAALTSATVTTPDVAASNGTIHAIDKVLVPPGVLNVVQMAQVNPQLTSLVKAVVSADLQGTLSGAGPFTVFAPTNAAFAAAPQGLGVPQLRTVLTYHVLGSQVLSTQIPFGAAVPTLANQSISFTAGTPPTIRDTTSATAKIVAVDVRASNGTIHVIDKVLIPAL